MKKITLLLALLIVSTSLTYASFPVQSNNLIIENTITPSNLDNNSVEAPVAGDVDWLLFWFCLFLGTLGVHRYIKGDIWQGVLMTLTLGGVYIWWLIDFIKICTGKMTR